MTALMLASEILLVGPPDMPLAACKGTNPEVFFPGPGGGYTATVGEAKALCGRCPELGTCRAWALEAKPPYGVWGGQTQKERDGGPAPVCVEAECTRRVSRPAAQGRVPLRCDTHRRPR